MNFLVQKPQIDTGNSKLILPTAATLNVTLTPSDGGQVLSQTVSVEASAKSTQGSGAATTYTVPVSFSAVPSGKYVLRAQALDSSNSPQFSGTQTLTVGSDNVTVTLNLVPTTVTPSTLGTSYALLVYPSSTQTFYFTASDLPAGVFNVALNLPSSALNFVQDQAGNLLQQGTGAGTLSNVTLNGTQGAYVTIYNPDTNTGDSPVTGTLSVTAGALQNSPPTGFLVTTATSSTITMTWTIAKPQGGVGPNPSYNVYRSSDGQSWVLLSSNITGSSYVDSGLSSSSPYYYRITMSGGNFLESAPTAQAQGYTLDSSGMPFIIPSFSHLSTVPISSPLSSTWRNEFFTDDSGTVSSNTVATVLKAGGYTYWTLEDINNGSDFLIAKFDSSGNLAGQTEITGTRYIWSIVSVGDAINFSGQADPNGNPIVVSVPFPTGFP